jgi:hypothetical protein
MEKKKPFRWANEKDRIFKVIKDESELISELKSLSLKHGGAWTFSILPFSHNTYFIKFDNPSKVPDQYIDLTHDRIGYKGKIVSHTKAARIREQNRGYSADR